ncbi:hypothetical protein PAXRUDRAFT_11456 [Paxillus rubicundulus Ve08.2h10]|uniref:F-box domain-containing protein n=1 Tax=Paxillus rubicundulus Ve08.2h10 TaxID=930991 RepID=A0A0D0DRA0_9AGAM|nr:hypothetical protein PAXRUDRAFT_11456 [Paxillus rubicundulus Ve08.2h10]
MYKQPTDLLNVLPPELVGYIFHLWLLDSIYPNTKYWHSQLPVLLCLVSKSWRDFVYASPFLWVHVIIEASQDAVPALHALRKRLKRSQSAPLFLDIVVGEHPDRVALRMLLAESSRFRHLTLSVLDLSWCDDIPTQGFTQLSKLTVHTGFQIVPPVVKLDAVFSSALHLRYVKWLSTGDPGPVGVNGHQLHSLDLTVFYIPGKHEYTPISPRGRVLLPELRSLVLDGTGEIACFLRSIRAPLLSCLDIKWWHYNGHEGALEALRSLLAYSPHLEEIALRKFLITEDGLISIITNYEHILRFTVATEGWQTSFITQRTFELLTRREHGKYALPYLEKLEFRAAFDVPDDVVLRMIESRKSPEHDVACTLKSICLDGCKPMAEESVSRLQAICQESGLKAEGTFVGRNNVSISTSIIAAKARTSYFSFLFDPEAVILWFRKLLLGRR